MDRRWTAVALGVALGAAGASYAQGDDDKRLFVAAGVDLKTGQSRLNFYDPKGSLLRGFGGNYTPPVSLDIDTTSEIDPKSPSQYLNLKVNSVQLLNLRDKTRMLGSLRDVFTVFQSNGASEFSYGLHRSIGSPFTDASSTKAFAQIGLDYAFRRSEAGARSQTGRVAAEVQLLRVVLSSSANQTRSLDSLRTASDSTPQTAAALETVRQLARQESGPEAAGSGINGGGFVGLLRGLRLAGDAEALTNEPGDQFLLKVRALAANAPRLRQRLISPSAPAAPGGVGGNPNNPVGNGNAEAALSPRTIPLFRTAPEAAVADKDARAREVNRQTFATNALSKLDQLIAIHNKLPDAEKGRFVDGVVVPFLNAIDMPDGIADSARRVERSLGEKMNFSRYLQESLPTPQPGSKLSFYAQGFGWQDFKGGAKPQGYVNARLLYQLPGNHSFESASESKSGPSIALTYIAGKVPARLNGGLSRFSLDFTMAIR